MSQAFYRKWRPQKWDQVVSQEHIVQTLRNAVRTGRTGHAYLLAGPRGTGKTTTARLLAKALNCLDEDPGSRPCDACAHCKAIDEGRFLDLIEIDAASNTSVDDVRDLREKINFSPSQGRYKVYIIDEVHMLSTAAFNALLKTLEEPPPHAIFILATTEVHKIPATILSRVQRYEFRRIPVGEIVKYLRKMAGEEGLEVDDDALLLIARQATGAMRDAISLLDQLASTGKRVTLEEAQTVLGTATNRMVINLVQSILDENVAAGLSAVQASLDGGTDPRQFARQVVEYLRSLLLVKMGNADQVDATVETRHEMAATAGRFELPRLLEAIRIFNNAAVDARSSWQPGLSLELAVAETAAPQAASQPAQAAAAIDNQTQATRPQAAAASANQEQASRPQAAAAIDNQTQATRPQAAAPPQSATRKTAAHPAFEEPPDLFPPLEGQPAASQPAKARPQAANTIDNQAQGNRPAASAQPAQAGGEAQRTVNMNDLQQNWMRIRGMVKKRNSLTEAALNSCRYSVKDGITLVLSFQTEVVKSKMETEENVKLLREALQAVLGVNMNIKCVLSGSKSGDADISGDSIVGAALNMGGKIVYEE